MKVLNKRNFEYFKISSLILNLTIWNSEITSDNTIIISGTKKFLKLPDPKINSDTYSFEKKIADEIIKEIIIENNVKLFIVENNFSFLSLAETVNGSITPINEIPNI